MTRFTNWIAGRSTPSKAGLYELQSRMDGEVLGEWPLSGKAEVKAWLDSLQGELPMPSVSSADLELAWSELLEVFREARSAWGAERTTSFEPGKSSRDATYAAGMELMANRLGANLVDTSQIVTQYRKYTTFGLGGLAPPGTGPIVVACDWDLCAAELFGFVAEGLFAGRPVLLLADSNLPMMAGLIVQAFCACNLAPGSLSLLHGLQPEAWECLASHREASRENDLQFVGRLGYNARTVLAPRAERSKELTRLLGELPAPQETCWEVPDELIRAAKELSQISAAEKARIVELEATVRKWAGLLVMEALEPAYQGLRHGAPLVAKIPRRVFSIFTEELLTAIEFSHGEGLIPGPVSGFESDSGALLAKRHEALVQAGLDEGATLASGGDPRSAVGGGVLIPPAVLVNLKSDSALLDLGEPLGVFRLQRA